MAKFYVESGELCEVVDSRSPVVAAARALAQACQENLQLALFVVVNERGFVRNRLDGALQATDLVLETGTLLALLAEHELA